ASPSHTNELFLDSDCKQVFMATGKSDLMVVDVSDPTAPDSCTYYGGVDNGLGAWGISRWENEIYLSYICALIPFTSFVTQATILSFDPCEIVGVESGIPEEFRLFPNPSDGLVQFSVQSPGTIVLTDAVGKRVFSKYIASGSNDENFSDLQEGMYFMVFQSERGWTITERLIFVR
ncbi:MAG: T9SS type A sorting domain-containing protein, partial [Flavobacteriales bacterium]|nr:T9SS type A sorting domain-containing protein [Flavobacteriales bacterium]